MDELGVYVIRVYRQDQAGIDGMVEAVASGEQLPFHSRDDLWQALYDLPSPWRAQPFQSNQEESS
jgi:hypothetical protein